MIAIPCLEIGAIASFMDTGNALDTQSHVNDRKGVVPSNSCAGTRGVSVVSPMRTSACIMQMRMQDCTTNTSMSSDAPVLE